MNRPDLDQNTLKAVKSQIAPRRQEVPVPPKFRHVIEIDWFRKFTWKERLRLLVGCNLFVLIRIPTLHKPGENLPVVAAEVTDMAHPSDMVKQGLKNEVARHMPKGYEIEVETKG